MGAGRDALVLLGDVGVAPLAACGLARGPVPKGAGRAGERRRPGDACFAYGTPLMAIYVGSALLFGGWIRRKGRARRRRLSWRERFGLVLGIAWAATGGYVLFLIYSEA